MILDAEPPLHLREPRSCARCALSGVYKPGTGTERLICHRTKWQQSCTFERAEGGVCGPEGKFWIMKEAI
jgi:hypothetical protein